MLCSYKQSQTSFKEPKRVLMETEKHEQLLIYNFALGVSSASDSSYILSSSARNFFAVCGRLSLSLFVY